MNSHTPAADPAAASSATSDSRPMRRLGATALLAGAVAAGAVAAVTVAGPGAGAATSCVAWASMPSHLHLSARHGTTLRMKLHSSGCRGVGFDNGAVAYLRGPRGTQPVYEQWSTFGETQTETFYANVNAAGTYRLTSGRVELYNTDAERIPARWSTTSVRVG